MSFSTEAWQRADVWYQAVLAHPFIRGLSDGTLVSDVFARYIVDDMHYLSRYSRALATTAARWPEPAGAAIIARFAAEAVDGERALHTELLGQMNETGGQSGAGAGIPAEPTPTCLAYANSLRADASHASVGVALAGLLPCFRIYAEVGRHLAGVLRSTPGHPYASWLKTYGDPAFAEKTRQAEELADEEALRTPGAVGEMLANYARSARFEWMFWDAAWRGETWPSPDR